MSAPELSEREQATVARFEAAPYPPEVALAAHVAAWQRLAGDWLAAVQRVFGQAGDAR